MADTTTEKTREEKLNEVHNVNKVYALGENRLAGANSEITFEAEVEGKKIPVTTKNFNREENHFEFGEAVFKE